MEHWYVAMVMCVCNTLSYTACSGPKPDPLGLVLSGTLAGKDLNGLVSPRIE